MSDSQIDVLRPDLPIRLNNVTCWYCGRHFDGTRVVRTTEHTIARRFVPLGKLARQWNLIGWACSECNGHKADMENDLSAISMQPDASGRYADTDDTLKADAERKAIKCYSRWTRKRVKDSAEKFTIRAPFAPGVSFKFTATSAPQASSERVYELARMQLMAFFYFLTFDKNTGRGGFWRGGFFPIYDTVRSDWGNTLMRGFMDAVVVWEPRLLAIGADGYFKAAIRRHPEAECWCCALEWNKKHRVIGFFGDQAAAETVAKDLPRIRSKTIIEGPDSFVRFHQETALEESDDRLFVWSATDRSPGTPPESDLEISCP